jgi:hypothetical protein
MSPDYLARLEQGRGAAPSVALVAALARALRLSRDERAHLFLLSGHQAPPAAGPDEHVSRVLLRLLDDLATLPALIASDLNVVLAQNALADALLGEQTGLRGYARSCTYRWFTDPTFRARQPVDDHEGESRAQVEDLRATVAARGGDRFATGLVRALRAASPEFTRLWAQHDVAVRRSIGFCSTATTASRARRRWLSARTPHSSATARSERGTGPRCGSPGSSEGEPRRVSTGPQRVWPPATSGIGLRQFHGAATRVGADDSAFGLPGRRRGYILAQAGHRESPLPSTRPG